MDALIHTELPSIIELAHDKSDEGRTALVKKLTDVFLAADAALTNHEITLVNQLISDLLKDSSASVRSALVTEFAQAVDAPREVAMRIANGPIEIARATLAANENLADDDLVLIIEKNGYDHAATIAARRTISEAVADALVTTGDISIMQIVAENLGAKLSPKAIDVLVDAGRLASMLHAPIMARPELTPEAASRLYWWVAKDIRRVTLERFGFGPGKLSAALDKTTNDILSALMLQKEDDTAMSHLCDWLQERGALTIQLLPRLLRVGHYRLFNFALSRLSHLDMETVDLINSASGARMMVVLCRAIEVEKSSFVSIFLMARGGNSEDQIIHPRELSQAIEAYDKLDPDMAKAILAKWRTDPTDIHQRFKDMRVGARA